MITRLATLLCLATASAQAVSITSTLAGAGRPGFAEDNVNARGALLDNPFGITRGPDGLLYFCEYKGHVVRRITKDGTLQIVAGVPGQLGFSGDGGPATRANLNNPHEIRFDKDGNLYIADTSNHVVRKVDMKTSNISTIAGTPKDKGFAGDGGAADKAKFSEPISIQFGPDGDLYICDIGNNRLRKVDLKTKKISTVCGNGKKDLLKDGDPFSEATPLKGPRTIDFDKDGNGWLALREGNAVYKIDIKDKKLHHVAGIGKQGNSGNGGPAKDATLAGPKGIAVSPDGKLVYLADTENHSIRVIDVSNGKIDVLAGTGRKADGPDGPGAECGLTRPHGVFVDKDGTVYIGDSENHRIREVIP